MIIEKIRDKYSNLLISIDEQFKKLKIEKNKFFTFLENIENIKNKNNKQYFESEILKSLSVSNDDLTTLFKYHEQIAKLQKDIA